MRTVFFFFCSMPRQHVTVSMQNCARGRERHGILSTPRQRVTNRSRLFLEVLLSSLIALVPSSHGIRVSVSAMSNRVDGQRAPRWLSVEYWSKTQDRVETKWHESKNTTDV